MISVYLRIIRVYIRIFRFVNLAGQKFQWAILEVLPSVKIYS